MVGPLPSVHPFWGSHYCHGFGRAVRLRHCSLFTFPQVGALAWSPHYGVWCHSHSWHGRSLAQSTIEDIWIAYRRNGVSLQEANYPVPINQIYKSIYRFLHFLSAWSSSSPGCMLTGEMLSMVLSPPNTYFLPEESTHVRWWSSTIAVY